MAEVAQEDLELLRETVDRLPTAADLATMQQAIDFVAFSWWRRWIIRLVSNGKIRFEKLD